MISRFQVMSDLHLEFHKDSGRAFVEGIEPAAPYLLLAGDIFQWTMGDCVRPAFEALCAKYERVVYVPGNHEYYGGFLNALPPAWLVSIRNLVQMADLSYSGFTDVGDYRVHGCTMWFPLSIEDRRYMHLMNDFHVISGIERQINGVNYRQVSGLRDQLRREKQTLRKNIVVTHHAPSTASIMKKYEGDDTNRFYVTDVTPWLLSGEYRVPDFWVHGHMHDVHDYMMGSCRVVCNPLGYPREQTGFKENFVIGD